jgi:hypothetical protein
VPVADPERMQRRRAERRLLQPALERR